MAGAQLTLPIENDVHRFVSVRGVNLPEAGAKERRFAYANLPDNYTGFDSQFPGPPVLPRPLLLAELPKLKTDENRRALMARAIQAFVDQSPYRIDAAELSASYPLAELRQVELWHRDENRDRSLAPATFIARVEAALGATVSAYTSQPDYPLRKIKIWENLVAQ